MVCRGTIVDCDGRPKGLPHSEDRIFHLGDIRWRDLQPCLKPHPEPFAALAQGHERLFAGVVKPLATDIFWPDQLQIFVIARCTGSKPEAVAGFGDGQNGVLWPGSAFPCARCRVADPSMPPHGPCALWKRGGHRYTIPGAGHGGTCRRQARDCPRSPGQAGLELRIRDICATRVRYGFRRIHLLLRR